MKKHNGMRPHDIAILLKIASQDSNDWLMKDIAVQLGISSSEVSESLNRSAYAGLISNDKKTLKKMALLDFLKFGLKYVYPQQPGALVKGLATAHAASPLKNEIMSNEAYVWPYVHGDTRGQALEPLHPKIPEACLKDPKFYELMALTDALRVGRVREQEFAYKLIKERIENA